MIAMEKRDAACLKLLFSEKRSGPKTLINIIVIENCFETESCSHKFYYTKY